MKIQYWGTAAQEGIPALFCNCESCKNARAKKGKNIRTRTQILINDDLLIDFGPDTFVHSTMYGFNMSRLGHILVTHPHDDHFYPNELTNRLENYAKNPPVDTLVIHGAEETLSAIRRVSDNNPKYKNQTRIVFDIMKPYETRKIGDYLVTPLPARHTTECPFIYLIEEGGVSFLVMNDTGRPTLEVHDYLAKRGITLAGISFDTTYGVANTIEKFGKVGHHMGLVDNFAVKEYLATLGVVNKHTVCIATHFSHLGNSIDYDKLCEIAENYGMIVSYDGMTIEV